MRYGSLAETDDVWVRKHSVKLEWQSYLKFKLKKENLNKIVLYYD